MILTKSDIDLIEQWWINESRESFYHYRQFLNYPKFKKGWFTEDLSENLQQFHDDMLAGLRPMLVISAPPQHGKSTAIIDFLSWFLGKHPEYMIIYSAFSKFLSEKANRLLQRIFESRKFKLIFPDFKIGRLGGGAAGGGLVRNSSVVETSEGGYFRNTTVGGAVTGESLDLGVIDDPIKGRKAANSQAARTTAWDWLTDDFMTRFSEFAGLLMITTRWHIADPAGKLIDTDEGKDSRKVKCLNYEAINKEGNALFPEHKSLDFLKIRKGGMMPGNWQSLYQGNPVIDGGNIIKSDWWKWGIHLPNIKYRYITADTAQKKNNWNDYTVFQAWGMDYENNIHLLDQQRKRMTSPELRKEAKEFYDRHNGIMHEPLRGMWIEDKSSGSGLIQELELKKMKINAVQRSTDKIQRANDVGPEIKRGAVYLYKTVAYVDVIVDEGAACPDGLNDDAFDCTMTAIEVAYLDGVNVDYAKLI